MLRLWTRSVAVVALLMGLLSLASCEWLFGPGRPQDPVPPPPQESSVGNVEPLEAATDPFPLFVGARWVYRDATADIDPEVRPGAHVEVDVLGTARRVDPASGIAYDCYVLRARQAGAPDIVSYLHRGAGGIDLYGAEIARSMGAPDAVRVTGERYLPLPLGAGLTWGFADLYGSALDGESVGQEPVPLNAAQRDVLRSYAAAAMRAWHVEWAFRGALDDAYGPSPVDTWLVPGVGVAGRSARSRYYELTEFRAREDVVELPGGFRDAAYPHRDEQDVGAYNRTPTPGQVLAVQFRGEDDGASSGWRWEIEETCWLELAEDGVLSPLWLGDSRGVFLPDRSGTQRLLTGSTVFLFEVRTAGAAELRFRRVGVGDAAGLADAFVYTFGTRQPIVLSDGSATHLPTDSGAVATFTVHYQDGDGVAPGVRQLIVYRRGESPQEGKTYDMAFASGKLADGDYVYTTTSGEFLSLWTDYWYSFHFENSEGEAVETRDLGPFPLYVGGPSS